MDKKLVKFIEQTYQMAQIACDVNDVRTPIRLLALAATNMSDLVI